MKKDLFEDFDQQDYENQLNKAKRQDVHLVHTFDVGYPFGGFAFVWQRTTDNPRCKMIRVAVSYCSEKDQYCRKIGAYNALNNFFEDNWILLPVGNADSAIIVQRLRDILDIMYF